MSRIAWSTGAASPNCSKAEMGVVDMLGTARARPACQDNARPGEAHRVIPSEVRKATSRSAFDSGPGPRAVHHSRGARRALDGAGRRAGHDVPVELAGQRLLDE